MKANLSLSPKKIWVLTEIDNIGSVERMNIFTEEEDAIRAHINAMIDEMDDGGIEYQNIHLLEYDHLVDEYLQYLGNAADPARS